MRKQLLSVLLLVTFTIIFVDCGSKKVELEDISGSGMQFEEPKSGDTIAEIVVKDYGSIYLKFFEDAAPKAVENFITHAKDGYYDGLIFHRVIKEFMIQGGDPTGTGMAGESIWGENFEDEFSDDLFPYRGALCMANSGANTNGSQFFIVQANGVSEDLMTQIETTYTFPEEVKNNYIKIGGTPWLHNAHTVFGQMISGYDVLDAIATAKVDASAKPTKDVIIEKINITEY